MNDFGIQDLAVGQTQEFRYKVTAEKMEMFRDLTGDINPLHTDEAFAVSHGFPSCVSYGMLTASLISTLGGCYLPGKYCLIREVEVKFTKPVFAGDELRVIGEVCKVDYDLHYLEVKVAVLNQDNKKVLRGLLKAGVIGEG